MRRLLPVLALVLLAVVLVVGLMQASGGDDGDGAAATEPRPNSFDLAAAQRRLAGAPPELASLHDQGAALLGGGVPAFERRLDALEGRPVVVNKWASWCGPCRFEFPFFQEQSTARGRHVAFVGVNAGDNRSDAGRFLREQPVPFPSYEDPDEKIAKTFRAAGNYPVTAFYDRRGRLAFVHQGQYRAEADLAADIDRYARGR